MRFGIHPSCSNKMETQHVEEYKPGGESAVVPYLHPFSFDKTGVDDEDCCRETPIEPASRPNDILLFRGKTRLK